MYISKQVVAHDLYIRYLKVIEKQVDELYFVHPELLSTVHILTVITKPDDMFS